MLESSPAGDALTPKRFCPGIDWARDRILRSPGSSVGILTMLAFLPSLWAGFVVDDLPLIVENPYAQSLSHIARAFTTHFWDVHATTSDPNRYYRPVISVSYALNWVVGGGTAWTFHLVNVLAHALAAALATRIACRWLGSTGFGVFAGLAFALHPTRTESVIWVSGRTDVFMALFLLCGVELAHRANAYGSARWLASAAGVCACAVGAVLSKELAVVFPVLLAIDWTANPRAKARSYGALVGVTTFMVLAYVSARWVMLPVRSSSVLQPWLYGVTTVGAYIERIVWPWPQTLHYRLLTFENGAPQFPVVPLILGAAALAGAIGWSAVALRRGDRWVLLMLCALTGTMGPVLNFVRTGLPQTTSDRFLYFPLFLVTCLVLRPLALALTGPKRGIALSLALALVLVWVGVDVIRVGDYRSQEAFWEHELGVDGGNPYALVSVGDAAVARGNSARAELLFRRALEAGEARFEPAEVLRTRLRIVSLEIDRTADGDTTNLEALLREIHSWCPTAASRTATGYCRLARVEHAFVLGTGAVRLGWDSFGTSVLRDIDDDFLIRIPNVANLALAHARLGDFGEARRLVRVVERGGARVRPIDAKTAVDLLSRIGQAEAAMKQSQGTGGIDAAIMQATAMAELGAYLRALRVLSPYLSATPEEVRPLLVQLLVAARLESAAIEIVGDEAAGRTVVSGLRAQLPDRIRELAAVRDDGWRTLGGDLGE